MIGTKHLLKCITFCCTGLKTPILLGSFGSIIQIQFVVSVTSDAFSTSEHRVKCFMNINHILSVEKLRDGGSLIISFQSHDSCEYWLMFPKTGYAGDEILYGSQALINRTTSIEVELEWSDANDWLHRLESYISNSGHLALVTKMQSVIDGHT